MDPPANHSVMDFLCDDDYPEDPDRPRYFQVGTSEMLDSPVDGGDSETAVVGMLPAALTKRLRLQENSDANGLSLSVLHVVADIWSNGSGRFCVLRSPTDYVMGTVPDERCATFDDAILYAMETAMSRYDDDDDDEDKRHFLLFVNSSTSWIDRLEDALSASTTTASDERLRNFVERFGRKMTSTPIPKITVGKAIEHAPDSRRCLQTVLNDVDALTDSYGQLYVDSLVAELATLSSF